jgi:O-antigen/teichoic acid export membrane protein
MRERFLTLARQTLIYGISSATVPIVGVLTLPFFARVFSPAEFGVLEVATVGFAVLMIAADAGLVSASQRSFFDYSDDQEPQRRSVLTSAVRAALVWACALMAAILLLAGPLSRSLYGVESHDDLLRIVGVALPVAIVARITREVMRLRFQPWRYTVSAMLEAVGGAAAALTIVLAFDAGIRGALLGIVIGNALAAVWGLAIAGRDLVGHFSRVELRRMLAYGLPLLPAAVALWGLAFLDRVMLASLGSLSDTGEYAVASRLGAVLMLLITAFATAYIPFQFSLWQENRELELEVRGRLLTYLAIVLVALATLLTLFAREILGLLAPDFDRAYEVAGLLTLGVAVFGVSNVALTGIGLTRRTGYVAIYTTIAVVINACLNVALIPTIGMFGAAVGTLVGYVVLTVLYYRKAQELYPTGYTPLEVVKVFAVGAVLMTVGLVPADPIWLALSVKLLAAVAFVVALWFLGVLGEAELRELRRLAVRLRLASGAAT